MTWFKVDDGFHSHPKAAAVSLAAIGLWVTAGSWSAQYETDGSIPRHMVPLLSRGQVELADELVHAQLWERADGGYRFIRGDGPDDVWSIEYPPVRRRDIPRQLRERIYERDEHCCVECGAVDDLTLDHIYPWSLGGPDTEENLRTLCRPCNSSKGARI